MQSKTTIKQIFLGMREFDALPADNRASVFAKLNQLRDVYGYKDIGFYWHRKDNEDLIFHHQTPLWGEIRRAGYYVAAEVKQSMWNAIIRDKRLSPFFYSWWSDHPIHSIIFEGDTSVTQHPNFPNPVYTIIGPSCPKMEGLSVTRACDRGMSLEDALDDLIAKEELLKQLAGYSSFFYKVIAFIQSLFFHPSMSEDQKIAEDLKIRLYSVDLQTIATQTREQSESLYSAVFSKKPVADPKKTTGNYVSLGQT